MIIIAPPLPGQYPEYFGTYISKVTSNDLVSELSELRNQMAQFIKSIPEARGDYSYDTGKWTVKEVLMHLADCERVFAYRALRFARHDETPLAPFEENEYAPASMCSFRKLDNIAEEFDAVRNATLTLFKNLHESQLDCNGIANNKLITVRALGYVIAGHQIHHTHILKTRYGL